MKTGKLKAKKRPARPPTTVAFRAGNATLKKIRQKSLIEMDSDEILERYDKSVAGGETKKKPKMRISGKSVFKIRDVIFKKAKKT